MHGGLPQGPGPAAEWSARASPPDAGAALTSTVFDLPDRLAHKADPALIADDERHFAAIAESLQSSIADVSERLDAARRNPAAEARRRSIATWRSIG